jgi:hypothetical protein
MHRTAGGVSPAPDKCAFALSVALQNNRLRMDQDRSEVAQILQGAVRANDVSSSTIFRSRSATSSPPIVAGPVPPGIVDQFEVIQIKVDGRNQGRAGQAESAKASNFSQSTGPSIIAIPIEAGPMFYEVLARMKSDGRLLVQASFLPTAERFHLLPEIDRQVIGKTVHPILPLSMI